MRNDSWKSDHDLEDILRKYVREGIASRRDVGFCFKGFQSIRLEFEDSGYAQYKTWTVDYGLGIKHGLRYKTQTKHYGLGIKY